MIILGISCFYHDAAVAILVDGRVLAAAEEERFSRKKHDSSFPLKAIDFCLKMAKIKAGQVDWVVFYEKPFVKFERITLSMLATAPFARSSFVHAYKTWLKDKLWIKSILTQHTGVPANKILFSDHHISHAAVSYLSSNFKRSAIFTCDGVGEWTTTAWGVAKDNSIELRAKLDFPHSLGLFYSTFTQFLGFAVNEGEFKVMGLAPYGKPRFTNKVEKMIEQTDDASFKLNMEYFNFHLSDEVSYSKKFVDLLGVSPVDSKDSDKVVQVYADIAASAQKVLEEKILAITKYIYKETGEKNLCYSGGVALNGVANWKILKESGFTNLFIHPAAGDSGGALGAALYVYHSVLKKPRKFILKDAYFGAENTETDIKRFLHNHSVKAKKLSNRDLVKQVSDMLAKGKVIGWVRGRFEWGPRSLGARSILADPRSKRMKDLVNSKIKFREAFRPFAPVCLYEEAKKYFEVGPLLNQQPLGYMLCVVPVKKDKRKFLGAITHVDGTARPQFIEREQNPLYYDLVKSFGKRTKVPVLLNTSFNLKGEPIVNTCEDAYSTFMKSGIDALVLGNYLIIKQS